MRTADAVVPPLDEEIEGLLDDLDGIHAGVDLIRAGFRVLGLAALDRERTQTVLAALGGSEGADVMSLLAATIQRLTSYDANPALRGLGDDTAKDVRRIGEAVAFDTATSFPRDLVSEACARIDPYADRS
ncbi:hypothetical protein [Streptomyces sp.]|uniref:hypothetical protein n=1 Tax=Streptomyces sp. TaxID=1931 RepID=UPI002F3EF47F